MPVTYYVSASRGADTNDGLTATSPFARINDALSRPLAPGSSILLLSGDVFVGQRIVLNDRSGTDAGMIRVSTYSLDGGLPGNATIDGALENRALIQLSTVRFWSFSRLELRNTSQSAVVLTNGTSDVAFSNLHIHHTTVAFVAAESPAPLSRIVIRNSTIEDIQALPDGGNTRAFEGAMSTDDWTLNGLTVQRVAGMCLIDEGRALFLGNSQFSQCGYTPSNLDRAIQLNGSGATLRNVTISQAGRECVALDVNRKTSIEGSTFSDCAIGLNIFSNASGDILFRRNVMRDVGAFLSVNPTSALTNVSYVHNTFIGGRDGGQGTSGIVLRQGARGAFENNLITGSTIGTLLRVADAFDGGVVVRGNAFNADGGPQFYFGPQASLSGPAWTYAVFRDAGLTRDAGIFSEAQLTISPFDATSRPPRDASIIDTGSIQTVLGTLGAGCDGGFEVYCGAAPEPGAYESL
jgi:hypothetical protein